MSDGLSIQHRRITNADFRPCSSIGLAVRHPFTFAARVARLPTGPRVPLHSSSAIWEETAPVKLPSASTPADSRNGEDQRYFRWYFTDSSPTAGAAGCGLPPMLHRKNAGPVPTCSKGSRGSFRLTAGTWHLHHGYSFTRVPRGDSALIHYAILGRNLPDELRYLRTVIVTAAVYRGFGVACGCRLLNLPTPSRRQTLYVLLRVGRVLCF